MLKSNEAILMRDTNQKHNDYLIEASITDTCGSSNSESLVIKKSLIICKNNKEFSRV